MHPTSLENMQRCYERWLPRSPRAQADRIRVLDVGGANLNGSYADVFSDERFEYLAVDMAPGPGVDVVLDDPYRFPFPDDSMDVVVCGQVFEHAEFFWRLFDEMARVTHPDGMLFVIAPSAGPIHRHPVDCYRFYPDAMAALARHSGLHLLDCWLEEKGVWRDLTGVFSPGTKAKEPTRSIALPRSRFAEQRAPTPAAELDRAPELAVTRGEVRYTQTLAEIHTALAPRAYLEIGVRTGRSLRLADCPAIGIDPAPRLDQPLRDGHRIFEMTSDDFFDGAALRELAEQPPDLIFIDGMHVFEFVLRDFINAERWAAPSSLIVIDDIYPNHPAQATRQQRTPIWMGDVWKLHQVLAEHRPDLFLLPLDTAPSGLLLVAGLKPANRVLTGRYNGLVKRNGQDDPAPESSRLARAGARSPRDPVIGQLLETLRANRGAEPAVIASRLAGLVP